MYAVCFYPCVLFGFAPRSQGLSKEALNVASRSLLWMSSWEAEPPATGRSGLRVHELNLWEQQELLQIKQDLGQHAPGREGRKGVVVVLV